MNQRLERIRVLASSGRLKQALRKINRIFAKQAATSENKFTKHILQALAYQAAGKSEIALQQALASAELFAALDDTDSVSRRASLMQTIGDLYIERDQLDQAQEYFERAHTLYSDLIAQDSENAGAKVSAALGLITLGEIAQKMSVRSSDRYKALSRAQKSYMDAMPILEGLTAPITWDVRHSAWIGLRAIQEQQNDGRNLFYKGLVEHALQDWRAKQHTTEQDQSDA